MATLDARCLDDEVDVGVRDRLPLTSCDCVGVEGVVLVGEGVERTTNSSLVITSGGVNTPEPLMTTSRMFPMAGSVDRTTRRQGKWPLERTSPNRRHTDRIGRLAGLRIVADDVPAA